MHRDGWTEHASAVAFGKEHQIMTDRIEHVVVLMMENSSFDRMLGIIPGVDGIDPANLKTNPDFPGNAPNAMPNGSAEHAR
jgi:phospholipase C